MKNRDGIRYIVELMITLLIILFIAVVLVRMFAYSANRSAYAESLTDAVRISENLAEISSGAENKDALVKRLETNDEVISVTEAGEDIKVLLSAGKSKDKENSRYLAVISMDNKEGFVNSEIQVYDEDMKEALFSMQTGYPDGVVR